MTCQELIDTGQLPGLNRAELAELSAASKRICELGTEFEALSWMPWRTDYSFPPNETGLKRTIKEYLRENFYGGILAGEYAHQPPGAMDSSWSLSFNAYQGMVNMIGIDRIAFTTDYPFGNIKAALRMAGVIV